ncbi:hypothetical protein [Pseudothermotoga thermarum]|uniref:Uncharacterized protein n=1 Tax=Pseudothermotoga thermarum DSM 5069 TaxID=688269 RepID=F7YXP1_9THEM|nr:hypothetical protein [Pseudothermotoga thermarum]AEH50685.1 hypothetical protein Theth_0597 [Pseudothermotoga thermarum DSM 5069]
MGKSTVFALILPVLCVAAVVNVDFCVGDIAKTGLTFLPRLEFWKVNARLYFDLSLVFKDEKLTLASLSKPEESLRDLSILFDSAGIKYGVVPNDFLFFTNVGFSEKTLSAWAFDKVFGACVAENNYLVFLNLNFFAISVGSDGSYHLAIPVKFKQISLGPFLSDKGYGFCFRYGQLNILGIFERGLRITVGQPDFVIFSEYLDEKLNVGISWNNDEEWLKVSNNGFSFRKRIGAVALICKFEWEEWYAGFSFPIFW